MRPSTKHRVREASAYIVADEVAAHALARRVEPADGLAVRIQRLAPEVDADAAEGEGDARPQRVQGVEGRLLDPDGVGRLGRIGRQRLPVLDGRVEEVTVSQGVGRDVDLGRQLIKGVGLDDLDAQAIEIADDRLALGQSATAWSKTRATWRPGWFMAAFP